MLVRGESVTADRSYVASLPNPLRVRAATTTGVTCAEKSTAQHSGSGSGRDSGSGTAEKRHEAGWIHPAGEEQQQVEEHVTVL